MKVWVIYYVDRSEVDICASEDAAIRKGREYLDSLKGNITDEVLAECYKEFEQETKEYGAEYGVEDVMWCRPEEVYE